MSRSNCFLVAADQLLVLGGLIQELKSSLGIEVFIRNLAEEIVGFWEDPRLSIYSPSINSLALYTLCRTLDDLFKSTVLGKKWVEEKGGLCKVFNLVDEKNQALLRAQLQHASVSEEQEGWLQDLLEFFCVCCVLDPELLKILAKTSNEKHEWEAKIKEFALLRRMEKSTLLVGEWDPLEGNISVALGFKQWLQTKKGTYIALGTASLIGIIWGIFTLNLYFQFHQLI